MNAERFQIRQRGGRCVFGRAVISIPVLALLLSGCDFPGKPSPSDRPVSPENVLNFAAIYNRNCAGCHGPDGQKGPAPPLNDPLFRALVPEAELERVVNNGRRGTPMPAFAHSNGGTLTPAQVQVLVHGIKGASQAPPRDSHVAVASNKASEASGAAPPWGAVKPLPKNVPAYLLSKRGASHTSAELEQLRKGLFARACAGCHGDSGEGGEAGAINDPSFLALMSNQGLRRVIITGRPDLPNPDSSTMPDFAGTDGRDPDFRPLTSREIDDLVDLIALWRTAGAGETDRHRQTAGRSQKVAASRAGN